MNVLSPEKNIPAIAIITVMPEMSTARPDVAAAASSAAGSLRPARRSSRSRLDVEERVVDADGEPDQQDDLRDRRSSIGTIWLGSARRPDRREHRR